MTPKRKLTTLTWEKHLTLPREVGLGFGGSLLYKGGGLSGEVADKDTEIVALRHAH